MLGVPLSAVSDVTVTANRRMLLSGVTFSYIVIIDSGHTPDYYITKVETTEYSNNLLTSLSATTGIPIDDITIAAVTDLSPTFTPTSGPGPQS